MDDNDVDNMLSDFANAIVEPLLPPGMHALRPLARLLTLHAAQKIMDNAIDEVKCNLGFCDPWVPHPGSITADGDEFESIKEKKSYPGRQIRQKPFKRVYKIRSRRQRRRRAPRRWRPFLRYTRPYRQRAYGSTWRRPYGYAPRVARDWGYIRRGSNYYNRRFR